MYIGSQYTSEGCDKKQKKLINKRAATPETITERSDKELPEPKTNETGSKRELCERWSSVKISAESRKSREVEVGNKWPESRK